MADNNAHKFAGTTGAAFILVHASVKQWVALAARTYAVVFKLSLETYDWISYMPLVVFVGSTDDPDSDDGLELAGLAPEPLRGWTRCNAYSVQM